MVILPLLFFFYIKFHSLLFLKIKENQFVTFKILTIAHIMVNMPSHVKVTKIAFIKVDKNILNGEVESTLF